MRTARNQPAVDVMIDSVGIRISVRGISPAMMLRRVSNDTPRKIGPITKPMNRSMPVHSAPVITCTKLRNQRLGLRIAAIITAKAAAAATRYQSLSGAATRTGCAASVVLDNSKFLQRARTTVAIDTRIAKQLPWHSLMFDGR